MYFKKIEKKIFFSEIYLIFNKDDKAIPKVFDIP